MILSIETSTPACTVALHKEGILLGSYELQVEKSHAEALTQLIEHLLKSSRCTLKDLEAIALSKGPGSYTGLRIGTSTAKGLCYGLQIPLIAVNTLEAMASSVQKYFSTEKNIMIAPMIDARRMEVYTAFYDYELNEMKETHAKIIDEHSFEDQLQHGKVVIFGNGAQKCTEVIFHSQLLYLEGLVPHAKDIGKIAYNKFLNNEFEDTAYFEPFYLKEFVAGKPKKSPLLKVLENSK